MPKWTLPGVAVVVLLAWLLWPKPGATPTTDVPTATGAAAQLDTSPTGPESALDLQLAARAAIAGTVYDAKGAPLAGAQVCARPGTSKLGGADALRRRCAITERDGHYQIDGLFGVPHIVNASAPGFIPVMFMRGTGMRRYQVALRPGTELRDIDLTLEGGGVEIHGVVEDLSGGPVEGAEVTYGGLYEGSGMAFATSGPDGGFALWVRPGRVSVRAEADGYVSGGDSGPAPGHRFEVLLTPEAVLIGKVVRVGDGSPVAGAEVSIAGGYNLGAPVVTDEGGKFRIGGLHPGAYKPQAESDDAFGVAAELVLLGLGETSEQIEIQAHPAFAVEGKIVTADGRPCEQGDLTLSQAGSKEPKRGSVDESGLVHVRGVLAGEYMVGVLCTGFVSAEQYPAVRVANTSVTGLRWQLDMGRAIRGVVVDPRGKPVPRVNVNARPRADPAQPRARSLPGHSERSDEQGRFEVPGLLPGAYDLSIYSFPESRARPDKPIAVTVLADRDLEGVRIEMPAVGELRGKVRDTRGRGIARASIEVSGVQGRRGTTADDGSFRIENIGAGSYRVLVRRGSALLRPTGKGDDAVQGEAVEILAEAVATLDLVVADPSGTIVGVVRNEDGAPVQDAYVAATRESDSAAASGGALENTRIRVNDRPVLTDADGRFRVEGLSPGKYTLQAQRTGGEAVLEHAELGADVTLTIAAASRLAGTVSRHGGGAPDEFSVTVHNRPRGFSRTDNFFRTGGAWGFGEVPPGDIEVQVSGVDGTKKIEVKLGAGEQKSDLRIELAAKVTVRGTVVDLNGAAVVGVEVKISETGSFRFGLDDTDRKHISDDAGRFEVAHAPTGPVTILVGRPDDTTVPWTYLHMEIAGGPVVELPPLRVSRLRTKPGEAVGDLGYVLRQTTPGTAPDQVHHVVAVVRPGSPAATAGLQVGDEIVAVDGQDVAGASAYLYHGLITVAEGTTIQLGLVRGVTLAVTTAKRL